MHFYWRILEELRFVGETWTITDPSLLRSYRSWLRKNALALQQLEGFGIHRPPWYRSPWVN